MTVGSDALVSHFRNISLQDNGTQTIINANIVGDFLDERSFGDEFQIGEIDDNDIYIQIVVDSATDQIQSLQAVYAPDGTHAPITYNNVVVGQLETMNWKINYYGYGQTSVEIPADVIAGAVEE